MSFSLYNLILCWEPCMYKHLFRRSGFNKKNIEKKICFINLIFTEDDC